VKIRAIWFGGAALGALMILVCGPKLSLAQSTGGAAAALVAGAHASAQPLPGANLGATPGQSFDDSTLEIAPERPPEAQSESAPTPTGNPEANPAAATVGPLPNSIPGSAPVSPAPRPYLGITVRYTTSPDLGPKEHGLEVISVDPGSPAEKAGLKGLTGATAAGTVGKGASEVLGPLGFLTMPLLRKTGALGEGGDLIVAVDDERIHSQEDLANKLAQLKPGDTLYLTVVRSLGNGQHHTVKVAVTLGGAGRYVTEGPSGAPWTY
jgi:PDZ domain